MKLTSKDLLSFKIIDEIIPEPVGGAHRGKEVILENVLSLPYLRLHKVEHFLIAFYQ